LLKYSKNIGNTESRRYGKCCYFNRNALQQKVDEESPEPRHHPAERKDEEGALAWIMRHWNTLGGK
jgi:hypothetical protein